MAHEIVVGVSGGIAAYKTAALVSDLVQTGIGVTVVMTRAAEKFVGPATFQALTGRRVLTRTFDRHDHPLGAHIELARQAELLCVAPATAHLLAQAAHGLADDLLSTLLVSFTAPHRFGPRHELRNVGKTHRAAERRATSHRRISFGWPK